MCMSISLMRRGALAAVLALTATCGEPRATAVAPPAKPSMTNSPGLVLCPTDTTQTTSTIIGLLGGTVGLGSTAISIPAGALSSPTLITLTIPASQYMEISVQAGDFLSFLFNQPVSITIDYSRCNRTDIDNLALTVWHIDPVTNQLLENMGGVDDKTQRTITFTTSHLSTYAVGF